MMLAPVRSLAAGFRPAVATGVHTVAHTRAASGNGLGRAVLNPLRRGLHCNPGRRAAEAAPDPSQLPGSSFLVRAQVDAGFWKGAAYLGGAAAFGLLAPHWVQAKIFTSATKLFRMLGCEQPPPPPHGDQSILQRR